MTVFVSSGLFSDDPGTVVTRLTDGAALVAAVLALVGARLAITHRRSPAVGRREGATSGG